MVIAIEPMVAAGTDKVKVLDDRWTAVTADGSYAAHFEHSVAITPAGPRILSVSDRGLNRHTVPA
jgi:methionyl aminopeptidase